MSLFQAVWRSTPGPFGVVFPIHDVQWTFPPGVINRHSFVLANICEVSRPEGQRDADFPFIGNATMTIHNIVPHDDGTLLIRLEVDWPSPIDIRIQFFVFD
jgi:hypothetical protein